MKNKIRIKAFYPEFFSDELISYVSLRIIRNFNDKNIIADIMGVSSDKSVDKFRKIAFNFDGDKNQTENRAVYRDAIPLSLYRFFRRIFQHTHLKRFAEHRFLKSLNQYDIAYLWPNVSLNVYRQAKSKGCTIVTEMINTMQATSKFILDKEFESLNLPITHGIEERAVQSDNIIAQLSDFIFSPSPGVTCSITDVGISPKKILSTSYGLKKSEILNNAESSNFKRPFTVLFVGQICVRKGIHLLLDAWMKSNINGKLRIVGRISPEIRTMFENKLKRNHSIEHVGFVNDLKPIYKNADVFILPSLEEGSPLVTYLALGAGLPVIASPMGAGGVISDGQEGIIIDPHNRSALSEAIQTLYTNDTLRKKMAVASEKKAFRFTWNRVADQRKRQLVDKLINM